MGFCKDLGQVLPGDAAQSGLYGGGMGWCGPKPGRMSWSWHSVEAPALGWLIGVEVHAGDVPCPGGHLHCIMFNCVVEVVFVLELSGRHSSW